jgi:hypothetical protein
MIQTGILEVLTIFFEGFFSTLNFNFTELENKYSENLRTITIEEIAFKYLPSDSNGTKYNLDTNISCLHRDPNFQKYLMERPHFKIKYNRKRSKNYNYISPTINR